MIRAAIAITQKSCRGITPEYILSRHSDERKGARNIYISHFCELLPIVGLIENDQWQSGGNKMQFSFQPIRQRDAEKMLTWRYETAFSLYNPNPDYLVWLLDPDNCYYSIYDASQELMGFFCLGVEAQVYGGDYSAIDALDVGMGLRPDLTSQGVGSRVFPEVLAFASREFAPSLLRVTVAQFNQRAMRMCQKAGFHAGIIFVAPTPQGPQHFVQMTRKAVQR
jgi:GNAT superfamily N-acetyltransferase